MIYGYARVSTKGQAENGTSLEAQVKALLEAGAEKIYKDAFTGGTMDRPEFSKLLKKLKAGDTLTVCKLDRFARTTAQGLETINGLLERGITIHIINMGIIDNSPMGTLIMTIFLAFAEFEKSMIHERMMEGKAASGHYGGRNQKYTQAQLNHAMKLLEGESYTEVSRLTGISKSTLIREARRQGKTKGQTDEAQLKHD